MKIKRYNYKLFIRNVIIIITLVSLIIACSPLQNSTSKTSSLQHSVPKFDHIVIVTFENKDFGKVIGNPLMPTFNMYAQNYTLLTQFHAVAHPSLPNYLAMIGGNTFNISSDCQDCFVNAPSLPDLIEASGRTWKTYQEDMQKPCQLGNQDEAEYAQKHNPFVYFDSIRLNPERCKKSVVSLRSLQSDIKADTLPNYIFITPNMCNNGHDCKVFVTDFWLMGLLSELVPALEKDGPNYLIVLNWDEGKASNTCCGLPEQGGGRIPVVLISPLVKNQFQDSTPYTHYSLLKTISESWGLPYLGQAAQADTSTILAPWK